MIYPSIDEITGGRFNRYELMLATAKCARIISEEAEAAANEKTGSRDYKSLSDDGEKPVKQAIGKLYNGEYRIVRMA